MYSLTENDTRVIKKLRGLAGCKDRDVSIDCLPDRSRYCIVSDIFNISLVVYEENPLPVSFTHRVDGSIKFKDCDYTPCDDISTEPFHTLSYLTRDTFLGSATIGNIPPFLVHYFTDCHLVWEGISQTPNYYEFPTRPIKALKTTIASSKSKMQYSLQDDLFFLFGDKGYITLKSKGLFCSRKASAIHSLVSQKIKVPKISINRDGCFPLIQVAAICCQLEKKNGNS